MNVLFVFPVSIITLTGVFGRSVGCAIKIEDGAMDPQYCVSQAFLLWFQQTQSACYALISQQHGRGPAEERSVRTICSQDTCSEQNQDTSGLLTALTPSPICNNASRESELDATATSTNMSCSMDSCCEDCSRMLSKLHCYHEVPLYNAMSIHIGDMQCADSIFKIEDDNAARPNKAASDR